MRKKNSLSALTTILVPLAGLLSSLPAVAQDPPKDPQIPSQKSPSDRDPLAELALSNDSLQLRYYDKKDSDDDSRFVGGAFLGEERDIVLTAAKMFPVNLGQHFDVTFGPQLYAALLNDENQDVMAVSIGAELRWFFDSNRRFAISGQAFYSPDILTFGAADNLVDLSARAEMQISDRLMAFGGMRWFEFDLNEGGGTQTLQEEVFFGVRYRM